MKYRLVTYLILAILFIEIALRIYPGLGKPLVFNYNESYAYQLVPNQSTTRLFKTLSTNSLGLRGGAVQKGKNSILKIGDSVINGGERVADSELSSEQLSEMLKDRWQVLNVSCGSWGPENQRKFLIEHPELKADIALVYISSHDYSDSIGVYSPVGWTTDYPEEKPPFAIWELLESFIFNTVWFPTERRKCIEDNQGKSAISDLIAYLSIQTDKIHFVIHPTVKEIEEGAYNWKGEEIIKILEQHKISYTANLREMEKAMYRDDIHLNEKGHTFLSIQAFQLLLSRGWIED